MHGVRERGFVTFFIFLKCCCRIFHIIVPSTFFHQNKPCTNNTINRLHSTQTSSNMNYTFFYHNRSSPFHNLFTLFTTLFFFFSPVFTLKFAGEKRAGCESAFYDMLFIVDTSASVGHKNFQKVTNWINELTESFQIGPDKTRFGILTYNDKINYHIRLDNGWNRLKLSKKIQSIEYEAGNTYTGWLF